MRYSQFITTEPIISNEIDRIFRIPIHYVDIMPNLEKCGVRRTQVLDLFQREYRSYTGVFASRERFFLMFGVCVLNPILNEKLGRPSYHPTFENLIAFSLKRFVRKPGL